MTKEEEAFENGRRPCSGESYFTLNKREYFAALAMQGAMVGLGISAHEAGDKSVNEDEIAIDAVKMADALLRELAGST